MKEKQTDIGVIVGRFQLHELHEAHIKLIETVLENHDKVILFLGTTSAIATRKNPLDFITRKTMIEGCFGTKIASILALPDQKSDHVWSNQIHTKVREVFPMGTVTLYGSRDSFLPYYKGGWNTCELVPETFVSATDIRETISKKTIASAEFRAGIIYSVYNQYPTTYSTVDLAIVDGKGNILLGRKPNEIEWRFIGGFVDPTDKTDSDAAKREGLEETGLELADFKFITSMKISDWRYRGCKDKSIMTRFYECKYVFGTPQPMDDIAELKWFKIESVPSLVGEHQTLFEEYKKYLINQRPDHGYQGNS